MIIDLYRAYTYFTSLGFTIYLITDISNPSIPENLESIVNNSNNNDNTKISSDIYDFINNFEDIKFNTTVRSGKDLISTIQDIIFDKNDNQVSVYYSGHARNGGLVMPNEDMVSIITFRDTLLNRLNEDSFVIFIMDCCNPQGGLLPYRLILDNKENTFKLLKPYRFDTVVEKNVILLASTNDNEKSYAARYGSLFTRYGYW